MKRDGRKSELIKLSDFMWLKQNYLKHRMEDLFFLSLSFQATSSNRRRGHMFSRKRFFTENHQGRVIGDQHQPVCVGLDYDCFLGSMSSSWATCFCPDFVVVSLNVQHAVSLMQDWLHLASVWNCSCMKLCQQRKSWPQTSLDTAFQIWLWDFCAGGQNQNSFHNLTRDRFSQINRTFWVGRDP